MAKRTNQAAGRVGSFIADKVADDEWVRVLSPLFIAARYPAPVSRRAE